MIDLGSMIGAGKESDVYLALAGDMCGRQGDEMSEENRGAGDRQVHSDLPSKGDYIVIKFHRLGRTSFRKVREKREYHQHRNTCSWLYLDRLAARREFEMMRVCPIFFGLLLDFFVFGSRVLHCSHRLLEFSNFVQNLRMIDVGILFT